jgi:hypothetical protein
MPHHHPYPADPPLAAFHDAYRIIKAGRYAADLQDLAADVWTIQGYLQKVLIGEHTEPFNGPPPVELRQAAAQLLAAIEERAPVVAAPSADVSLWLTLLLPLLQKLLEKLLKL